MLTLALDTATGVCTGGLVRDGHVLAEYDISVGLTHSEGLMPQVDQMFARTGIKKEEIDRIAVSIGPGSFTGLRIGLAAAEAMAYAWQCGICGVNTLEALAWNIPVEGVVLAPVLDAQKGNYYTAFYEWVHGELQEVQPVEMADAETLLQQLQGCGKPVLLMGECEKLLKKELPPGIAVASEQVRLPKASSVALAAEGMEALTGEFVFSLRPYYIRKSEAEELWVSRLLTLLLLYRSGYLVGKYISVEKAIADTKEAYYDALQKADQGWHEGNIDPKPFIKYMLGIVLSCYREFENRINIVHSAGTKSTSYDIVKTSALDKIGKFSKQDILISCPSLGSSSVESALKKLVDEGILVRIGAGRKTLYARSDSLVY